MSAYSNYYTSADTLLFIESSDSNSTGQQVMIDKLDTIVFSEGVSARPVYGVGNPIFGFTNVGNVIVSGEIVVRFIHQDYMLNAIKQAITGDKTPQTNKLNNFMSSSASDVRAAQLEDNRSAKVFGSRLLDMPYYFDFRLVFNNGNLYHNDINKELVVKDVRILGSELISSVSMTGPVNIKYKFIARTVR